MKLQGKTAIVTGGNSGIGEAIAHALAAEGANVVVAGRRQDRNEAVAADLRKRYGIIAEAIASDLSLEDDCLRLIAETIERFGQLDILINNAGRGIDSKHIADSTTEDLEKTLRANLHSAYWCSREAFKRMRELPDPASPTETRAAIINIASVCGVEAWAGAGIYCISKHAMMGLTKAMADEGAEKRIRVSAVCPGLVATPLSGAEGPDVIAPSDIAATVIYLLKLGAAAWPVSIVVDRRGAD